MVAGRRTEAVETVMIISVTQRDIESGTRFSPVYCPIALAIKRSTRRKVSAGCGWITFANGDQYNTPHEVRVFIDRYDFEKPVEPFTFDLTQDDKKV